MNNVLPILSALLKYGQKLELVQKLPTFDRLWVAGEDEVRPEQFYTFEEYRLLVEAAGRFAPRPRLAKALQVLRHLRGERVFVQDDGGALTRKVLRRWIASAQRLAQVKVLGRKPSNIHVLRHTFCSHLAMRGAPAVTIRELAGHAHLSTTMRYMHLQAGAKEAAIALLAGSGSAAGGVAGRGRGAVATAWQRAQPMKKDPQVSPGVDGAGRGISNVAWW